jgi:iron complex transport system ATP-binding protein
VPLYVTHLSDAILHDISLRIDDEENLLILGLNGAGKTTLAKYLAGITPHRGVTNEHTALYRLDAAMRRKLLDYVPARFEVFDDFLTVEGYLALACNDEACALETVAERCRITHLLQHRCVTLSSGESALVRFASAMLQRSHFCIFDEPTANLDPSTRAMLFRLLKEDNHFTSRIVLTHDLTFAYKLGYRVIFLRDGRIDFDGSCEDFFNDAVLRRFYGEYVRMRKDGPEVTL